MNLGPAPSPPTPAPPTATSLTKMPTPPSLFVLVPGFGGPHIPEKLDILQKNIARIQSFPWAKLHITICVYDTTTFMHVPSLLREHPCITWVYEPGIVGQYIHKWARPSATAAYDYVMIILDDVELQENMDFNALLQLDRMFAFDIYSPTMTHDSMYQFNYMLTEPEKDVVSIKITCACEAFCYFMRLSAYEKYYPLVDPTNNPWLWGLDMCLYKVFGMRIGLLNHMTMKHHYKNECYTLRPDANPMDGREHLFQTLGVTAQELSEQKAILYWIFATPT